VNERGSILPLIGGAVVLALVMVFGVANATSLLIERQRLFALADGAAIAASESFDLQAVRQSATGVVAPLTNTGVQAAAYRYLGAVGPGRLTGVELTRAYTPDGRIATVTMSSQWSPPLVSDFFPASISLSVTASSQAFIR
jgi:hypothetical protein